MATSGTPRRDDMRQRRELLRLSQRGLAELAKVSPTTVLKIERGDSVSSAVLTAVDAALRELEGDQPLIDLDALLAEIRVIRRHLSDVAAEYGALLARIEALEARQ